MKAKEKNKRRKIIKCTPKNIVLFLGLLTILLYSIQFYYYYLDEGQSYAKEINTIQDEEVKISNAKEIEINDLIEEYKENSDTKQEYVKQEAQLEYITKYQQNETLPKGMIQVIQEGREGSQELTIKKTYNENNELVSEEQIQAKVTKASVNKIVEIGTAAYSSNYKVKVGDELYVTSDRLAVMTEANENSQKLATLIKDTKIKLLEINDNWYKISSSEATGWVKAENTTYINKNTVIEEQTTGKSKSELLGTLSQGMSLNKPSGLTLEQFKKVLVDSSDKNKIFENNAEYFYYIEKQYNINGIFVASMGIHESAWGTSQIAKNKNNLFGYGAYDSNPYNGAYTFSTYSECIDLIARVLVKYYINPAGTSIYGGETAIGTYYNGPTLAGVNTKYATDKNWANAVYKYMQYLYNKL